MRRMLKGIVWAAAILAAYLLLKPMPFDKRKSLDLAVAMEPFLHPWRGSESIALSEVAKFEWDEICVYGPYAMVRPEDVAGYRITSPIPSMGSDAQWYWLFKNERTHEAFFVRPPAGMSRKHEKETNRCFSRRAEIRKSTETDSLSGSAYHYLYLK